MNYDITTSKGLFLTSIGQNESVTSVFIEAQRVADISGETVNVTFQGRLLYTAKAIPISIDTYVMVTGNRKVSQ